MAVPNFANGWISTLTASLTNSATSTTVASTSGIPTLPCKARIRADGTNTDEFVTISANVAGTLTIARAVEPIADGSQTAVAHLSGAVISHELTAADLYALAGTVIATDTIWDAAGDLAVGSGADTAARLAKGAAGAVLAMGNSAVIWNAGTSFPASKATGDRYWRTDLDMEFYWDGTRWVSTTLYHDPVGLDATLNPATADANVGKLALWHSTFDVWMVAFYSSTFVLTTNDGSKYWTITFGKENAANSFTSIGSFTTGADTASNWVTRSTAIGAAFDTTTYKGMTVQAAKTSTPGNLYFRFALSYRLIAT